MPLWGRRMQILFRADNCSVHATPEKTGMTLLDAGSKKDAIALQIHYWVPS